MANGSVYITREGEDGITRGANFKTQKRTIRRTTRNLCPLPIDAKMSVSDGYVAFVLLECTYSCLVLKATAFSV